jgi:hypothetical protein
MDNIGIDAVRNLIGKKPTFSMDDNNIIDFWYSDDIIQPEQIDIDVEVTRLQTEYDSLAYARSRKQEYDKLNQWEMQFDDQRDGTTTWVDSINEIKVRFPK